MARRPTGRAGGYVVVNPTKAIFPPLSAPVGPYPTFGPVNTALPVISGTAQEGQVLSVSNGSWLTTPTAYAYQWRRDGVAISGSINSTRTLTSADVGHVISCTVTATVGAGSTPIQTASTAVVIAAAIAVPVITTAPAVTGTATVGSVLSTTNGTWSGNPTGYTYAWRRDGVDISGATASTYTLVSADAGKAITCRVYATNAGGTAGATSNAISVAAVTSNVLATTRGQLPTLSVTSGVTAPYTSRRSDWATSQGDITDLRTVDFQAVLGPNGPVQSTAMTFKRYCEYPANTFHQVTWAGGASVTIGGGSNPSSASSDVIVSSVTGQPLVIPAGAKHWWRTVIVTGTSVTGYAAVEQTTNAAALGIDDGNVGSDMGNSGTVPQGASSTAIFAPAAVIGTVKAANARGWLVGPCDSVGFGASGAGGSGDITSVGPMGGSGAISRGLAAFGQCKIARGGVAAVAWSTGLATTGMANFLKRIGYTDVATNLGTNDLSQNSTSVANILAAHQAIYNNVLGTNNLLGVTGRVWQVTMPARTDSTNNYADAAGQTPRTDGNYGQVNALNDAIRAKPAGVYGVIDLADFDMTARNSVIHAGPFPPVADGVHFLSAKAADVGSKIASAVGV